jgi:predicted outer membrane protein
MTLRKTIMVLTAATGLAFGSVASAQQQPTERPAERPTDQGQSGQAGQQRQQQADAQAQINRLLAKIAEDPKTAADKLFLLTAALQNQSEIALAREVANKSQNELVKQMAQQMVRSLEQTQQQLMQTAQAVGIEIPRELTQAAVAEVQIVAALPADQIDKAYTAAAQADNAQDLSTYQSQAQIAQDPQVKRFAEQQVPTIQQRSQSANQTAQGMGMPSGSGGEARPAGGRMKGSSEQR